MPVASPVLRRAALSLGAMALVAASTPASATLGTSPLSGADNHVANVVSEQRTPIHPTQLLAFAATGTATSASAATATTFTVNTVTLESGTIVREYVNSSTNQVFGVVWQGPRQPDLQQLLGASYARFAGSASQAAESVASGLSRRTLNAADLVVQTYGHMHMLAGVAYLPAQLPAGMSPSDIR
ncbi:DUF2844 domain-containing protein [Paraburkholderia sp. GAS448]|uniref:DUF2844 domain-containing protein n=1 Tax=Paraburkholderia sp. GAS448 TaxID=3035136 RepID=UPI003D200B6F